MPDLLHVPDYGWADCARVLGRFNGRYDRRDAGEIPSRVPPVFLPGLFPLLRRALQRGS